MTTDCITITDSKPTSYAEAVRHFEDTIAMDHIVRYVEWLIAVNPAIAPERLIDRLFEGLGRDVVTA